MEELKDELMRHTDALQKLSKAVIKVNESQGKVLEKLKGFYERTD